LAVVSFLLLTPTRALLAGPASYDGKTRSFQVNYTYAVLPSLSPSAGEDQRLGTVEQAEAKQDQEIREIILAAGAEIFLATKQRAQIKVSYVKDVTQADVVISLSGLSQRMGWATPGAIEGRPGQVGLYYKALVDGPRQDAILTVAHLFSHYLFDLPDEVADDGTSASCPKQDPGGPGCLMDKFLSDSPRRGYFGKYCDGDHNVAAPLPSTLSRNHSPEKSCGDRLDAFFEDHPPSNDGSVTDPFIPTPDEPTTGRLRSLVMAAYSYAQSEVSSHNVGTNRRTLKPTDSERSQVKSFAKTYLDEHIPYYTMDLDFRPPTTNELEKAAEQVARHVLDKDRVRERPQVFSPGLIKELSNEARTIAMTEPTSTSSPAPGTVPAVPDAELDQMVQKVKGRLLENLKKRRPPFVVADSPGSITIHPSDERFLEALVRDAVMEVRTGKARDAAGDKSTKSDQGGESKTGTRRMLILAPRPFDSSYDILAPRPFDSSYDIVTRESGEPILYESILELILGQLITPLKANGVDVKNLTPSPDPAAQKQRLLVSFLLSSLGITPKPVLSVEDRRSSFTGGIDSLIGESKKEPTGHVIIVVPPGSIPADLLLKCSELLNHARTKSGRATRFDVLKFGRGLVALPLRELARSSGGSVQRITTVQEIGVATQRLRTDLVSGSAVSLTQRGAIDPKAVQALFEQAGQAAAPPPNSIAAPGPLDRRPPGRITRSTDGQDSIEIEFDPFQAEEGIPYEFILGLSRPVRGFQAFEQDPDNAPRLRLYKDGELTDHPFLAFEQQLSSERVLCFRIPADTIEQDPMNPGDGITKLPRGKYTPKLLIRRDALPTDQDKKPVDYTFSIASSSSSVHLMAAVRKPLGITKSGTISSSQEEVIIEAEVLAGAPVVNCEIRGVVDWIDPMDLKTGRFFYTFLDDGVPPDLHKDDGIMTAQIALPPAPMRVPLEYHILLEASSAANTKFIPLVDPVLRSTASSQAKEPQPPAVPAFQRATSFTIDLRGRARG
jgi:hypothetical protein